MKRREFVFLLVGPAAIVRLLTVKRTGARALSFTIAELDPAARHEVIE
jgi:hypothetical protein